MVVLATAAALLAVSTTVSAVAVPRQEAQARFHMQTHNLGRRAVPVAPLPATVMAKMQADNGGAHVPGQHHREAKVAVTASNKKKGKGKKGKKGSDKRRVNVANAQANAATSHTNVSGTSSKQLVHPHTPRDHDHHHHHHHHHHGRQFDNGDNHRTLLGVQVKTNLIDKRSHNHHHGHGHSHSHSHSHKRRVWGSRSNAESKRAVIHIGPPLSESSYNRDGSTTLLHLEVGKRSSTKRDLGNVTGSLGYLLGLATRSTKQEARDHHHHHHHHHHHGRRDAPAGVEGTISIVSATADSTAGETIASLLLSSDPQSANAFLLNASNSSATHVYLVPANATAAEAGTSDGTMPVNLHVPVYDPDEAAMLTYCMQYDPNPPAPAPLTAQPCTDTVTDHVSQIFSYDPSNNHIVPLWAVSPTSSDPGAQSAPSPTDTTSATDSLTTSAATSTASATATDSDSASLATSTTSSAAPSKRSAGADDEVPCNDPNGQVGAASVSAAAAGDAPSSVSPQDVTLVFTPLDAAGVLPSSLKNKPSTTFSPPTAVSQSQSDDGDVGSESGPAAAAASASQSAANEDDGEDDGADDEDDGSDADDTTSDDGADADSAADAASAQDADDEDDAAAQDSDSETKDSTDDGMAGVVPANAVVSPMADAEAVFSADDLASPVAASDASPTLTPVPAATAPYSWMFSPQK